MIIGDRIKKRLDELGSTQAALARAIGVSPQAVSKMVLGGTTDTSKLYQIARFLVTTPEYLTGESDEPTPLGPPREWTAEEIERASAEVEPMDGLSDRRLSWTAQPVENADTVELEEFDVSFGLGAAYIHDSPVEARRRVFSRSWIRQFTQSPFDHLFWGTGIGDSMTPTILDADVVLIDTFDRTPRFADKLWAVEVGGLGSIKRLRPTTDGEGMRLLSSAPDVPEEIVFDGEMTIVGRVVAVVRKV